MRKGLLVAFAGNPVFGKTDGGAGRAWEMNRDAGNKEEV